MLSLDGTALLNCKLFAWGLDKVVTSYYNIDSNMLPQPLEENNMRMNEMYESFGDSPENMRKAIFSSIFVMQNRMQTAGEKIQTEITMKQWLLLVMATSCPEPRTLTSVGDLMGCSRQNIKKLAAALEAKGFVKLEQGSSNALNIEMTPKALEYFSDMSERYAKTFELLFSEFSEQEISQLFRLYAKLYAGIEKVEKFAEEI